MAKYLFVAFVVVFLASCTKKKCNYNRKIEFISVREWRNAYCPHKGKIYVYKKGEGFTQPIDSTNVYHFEISAHPFMFYKDTTDYSSLVCSVDMIDDLNYLHDVRLVLDDTLYYDVSQPKLSCVEGPWVMGGPTEWSIVSSLYVNGHYYDGPTVERGLPISHKFVRIQRK